MSTTEPWDQFQEEIRQEYEQAQRDLKEIDLLIRQSTNEVEALARREAQITTRLRQAEANPDNYPRSELRDIFSASTDAQLRLFMMRSQVEQLQNKQQTLQKYVQQLHRFRELFEHLPESQAAETGGTTAEAPPSQGMIIRIIEAQESERQLLARQMHDGPAQALTNLILQAEICERLFDKDPVQARTELGNLKTAVNATFQRIRDFIFDLRPMMLDDLGLFPTLRRYVQDFEAKYHVPTNLTFAGKDQRLPAHLEVTLFRAIQELLNNIIRHAHASHIQINLDIEDRSVVATVEDDGSGFDASEALGAAREQHTLGLASIKERIEMLGGSLRIESAIGRGTRVRVQVPSA